MAVYKKDGRAVYSYDFRLRGKRFSGTTGETSKRAAERYEMQVRADAETSIVSDGDNLTIEAAAAKWFQEVGQHHKNNSDTLASLAWIIREIGHTYLTDLSNRSVARLIARRRGEGVSNATVNRSVQEPLRSIHRRAAMVWEHPTRQIDWQNHRLKEPAERVRELTEHEQIRLFEALRDDYRPIVEFALIYGLRMQELLDLEWRHLDWQAGEITVLGKGDRIRVIELDDHGQNILRDLPRASNKIFTRLVMRSDGKSSPPRGARVPIEREALKIMFRRAIKRAGISDFRFHDLRHTAATRLMRATGDIKQAQSLLGHSSIATSARYIHTRRGDMRAALGQVRKVAS